MLQDVIHPYLSASGEGVYSRTHTIYFLRLARAMPQKPFMRL